MPRSTSSHLHRAALCAAALACVLLSGCAVVALGSAAVGIAATGAGLAVDAAVGTVKMTGRVLGVGGDAKDANK